MDAYDQVEFDYQEYEAYMAATNDITGDKIQTKPPNIDYLEGWDRIFNKEKKDNASPGGCETTGVDLCSIPEQGSDSV